MGVFGCLWNKSTDERVAFNRLCFLLGLYLTALFGHWSLFNRSRMLNPVIQILRAKWTETSGQTIGFENRLFLSSMTQLCKLVRDLSLLVCLFSLKK